MVKRRCRHFRGGRDGFEVVQMGSVGSVELLSIFRRNDKKDRFKRGLFFNELYYIRISILTF